MKIQEDWLNLTEPLLFARYLGLYNMPNTPNDALDLWKFSEQISGLSY